MRITQFGGTTEWLASDHLAAIPGGITIDPTKINPDAEGNLILKDGTFVGVLANGMGCPVKMTVLATTAAMGDQVIELENAELFQDNDPINVGNEENSIVSRDITSTPHKINLLAPLAAEQVAGNEVLCIDGINGPDNVLIVVDPYLDLKKQNKIAGGYDHCTVYTNRLPYSTPDRVKNAVAGRILFR